MELFKLFGTIAIDNSEANKDIDETTDKVEDSQEKISDAFSKIGTAVVTYFAVDKIVDFGEKCLNAAANAQAMESQFSQVFGDLGGEASSNLSAIADSSGIAENRLKGSYTQIAAFAKTTGMETADALTLADRAMIAVADSAAFYDRSLEDTTESLQSFLKGNFENDAALGLSCTETTRNAAANELYGKSFQDLSESQKQLTLLKMVEDANALSGALGQASRESGTWSNQTGNLKQAWTDFTAMIGEKFLPLAIKVVESISNIVTWMTEHEGVVSLLAIGVGTLTVAITAYNVAQTLATTGMTLATAAGTAFGAVMSFITSPITLTVAAIGALIAIIVLLVKNWDKVKEVASSVWEGIKNVWGKATDWFDKKIVQPITELFTRLGSGIKEAFKKPINWIIDGINTFIRGINKIKIPDWVPGVGGKGFNISTLPRLEKGGILEKGQVGLLEGNGAEAVVPLDQNSAWIKAVANDMKAAGIGGHSDVLASYFQQLLDMLADYFPQILSVAGHDIVTNDGAIIARYAPMMNSALGKISARKDRGR